MNCFKPGRHAVLMLLVAVSTLVVARFVRSRNNTVPAHADTTPATKDCLLGASIDILYLQPWILL